MRTIAIDRAVGTRLLPVALDLLPSTFITGAAHSPPLLQGYGLVQFAIGRGALMGVIVVDIRVHEGIVLILGMRARG